MTVSSKERKDLPNQLKKRKMKRKRVSKKEHQRIRLFHLKKKKSGRNLQGVMEIVFAQEDCQDVPGHPRHLFKENFTIIVTSASRGEPRIISK